MPESTQPTYISVRELRRKIRDVLDSTQFLNHCYIVTNYGNPIAQVSPPSSAQDVDSITVTDMRIRTKEILETVYYDDKVFLILRHNKAAAVIQPIHSSPVRNHDRETVNPDR
jgi:prevent-host-death family protein